MKRHYQIRDTEGNVLEEGEKDISWDRLRLLRDQALDESDWRFMSDQSPSDEWVAYRVFLRDLPQNHDGENGNDANDAWEDYDKPEGA